MDENLWGRKPQESLGKDRKVKETFGMRQLRVERRPKENGLRAESQDAGSPSELRAHRSPLS